MWLMRNNNCGWDNRAARGTSVVVGALCLAGCVSPQYAVRPTPVPEESASALQIEQAISRLQGREFEQQRARPIQPEERLWGFPIQTVVDRLSRVTERPSLRYRAYLYQDRDPNAAALADGRIYISSGLLAYLAGRRPPGLRPDSLRPFGSLDPEGAGGVDELAFVLGHEIAHTVAQHLVKRYRMLQQQALVMSLISAGAQAVATRGGSGAQGASQLALDAASMLQGVANSGYSQTQELEADQLGIRYVTRAGYDPRAALALLDDFKRFETGWALLRTHPYIERRREDLARYLTESGVRTAAPSVPSTSSRVELIEQRARLRDVQRLYPVGSQSWKNLQRQLDDLDHR